MNERSALPGADEGADEPPDREIERLRAQLESLRESEAMYRSAAQLSGRLAWSADPDGNILTVSEAFRRLTGAGDAEVLKLHWSAFVHPEDSARVEAAWRRARDEGQPYSCEYRARLADGSYRTVLSRAVPALDQEGGIRRWYGTAEDIQDRRTAELARTEAEERYRLVLRATNDVLWDLDVAGETLEWSDTASDMFGFDEPIGVTSLAWWEERLHPDDQERTSRSLEAAIDQGHSNWSSTYRFRRGDGSYADIFDRGFLIRGGDGKPVRMVGSMADLTALHRAEAELQRVEAELAQVARLGAMGTMASTLAHEINQPLTAVANYVRGARTMLADPAGFDHERLGEALQAAEVGAIRAGQIVRRLRELFSSGTVTMQRQDIALLIEEAGGLAFLDEHLLGVSHSVAVDPQARFVRCDRIQIQQVLINLVRNAVQAMEESLVREVVIETRRAAGDMVRVTVSDTGPGLQESGESIFSQFMTTKVGGMGLGLALSRTIVEAHGGKIGAEDRPEGGACIWFTLPRAD